MTIPVLYNTLQLSAAWDLMLDGGHNIAMQTASAAIAQDVGSVVQTFLGECWFDTTVGVPYLTSILGQAPNPSLWSALYSQAALTVPNVVSASTTFAALTSARKLSGTVAVIDTTGQSMNAHF